MSDLAAAYAGVRRRTVELATPLSPEDCALQSMPAASPVKWHLAHTTWFFEAFVLGRDRAYRPHEPSWQYLFNSYYQSVGPMHPQPLRGMLSRPTLDAVLVYRARIDDAMLALLTQSPDPELQARIRLGLHHEQQHQELLLTDVLHLFSLNPLEPAYRYSAPQPASRTGAASMHFLPGAEGIVEIGHAGDGFAFDCEGPRHRVLLHPHSIADRLVTNAEYREFIRDGGYRCPDLWLSDGWAAVQREGWCRPLYWHENLDTAFTLAGPLELDPEAPVCHVSQFEADAFARWADARLPTEAEWEAQAAMQPVRGHFADSGLYRPCAAPSGPRGAGPMQLYGDVWEWTSSAYGAYPGYRPTSGALGEYNGKFMSGQYVLRGGSCATPEGHVRPSYRNFFHAADRWQFSGIRLARDAS